LAKHIKILGVKLDKNLSMDDHINSVSRSVRYHIRALRHIRSSMFEDMAKMVACTLVDSRLVYANYVLYGLPRKTFLNYTESRERPCMCTSCCDEFFFSPVHTLRSNSSIGFPSNTALT